MKSVLLQMCYQGR